MRPIHVDTCVYKFNHGSAPRGRGVWWFKLINSDGLAGPLGMSHEVCAWRRLPYSEALAAAKRDAAYYGYDMVVVLP